MSTLLGRYTGGARLNRWRGKILCPACGADLVLVKFHIDHIHPKARGGKDEGSNYQLLCGPCNLSKGAKPMEEWAPWLLDDHGRVRDWNGLRTEAERDEVLAALKSEEAVPKPKLVLGQAVRVKYGRFMGHGGSVVKLSGARVKLSIAGMEKPVYVKKDQIEFS